MRKEEIVSVGDVFPNQEMVKRVLLEVKGVPRSGPRVMNEAYVGLGPRESPSRRGTFFHLRGLYPLPRGFYLLLGPKSTPICSEPRKAQPINKDAPKKLPISCKLM